MSLEGTIVKLDRGFPLVKCDDGTLVRCEHATSLVKGRTMRAVIGDRVVLSIPPEHDKGVIETICERRTALKRKDPAQRTLPQVLAANFDVVIIAEPVVGLNRRRIERELVLACETGARVAVLLTKADLAGGVDAQEAQEAQQIVDDLAGPDVVVRLMAADDPQAIEAAGMLVGPGEVGVLIGKSGVGKSSLVNLLAGSDVQETAAVRDGDGKGRHTTVDRVMVELPDGGFLVDMPGVRGLGLWDAETGVRTAFADVDAFAQRCRFRDCVHDSEPGCAVRDAVECGDLAFERVRSYRALMDEVRSTSKKRDEARHKRGEKASDRKRAKRRQ